MKHWRSIALWTAFGMLVLIAGAASWLWTADLGVFKPQIERLISDATGRDLRIGTLSIDLGGRSTVIAEGIAFENAPWASAAEMATIERLEVQLDLWSLVSGPAVIYLVDVDGARVYLTRPETGLPNWVLPVDEPAPDARDSAGAPGLDILIGDIQVEDARIVFDSHERTGPIDLRIESLRQRHRDDDVLELALSGSIGDRHIGVEGELGTLQALRTGQNIRYSLAGDLDSFSIESTGFIDSLGSPRHPSLTFSATGPDINDLFALAGVDGSGEGDINLSGSLEGVGGSPLELSVEGNLGRLEIDATGSFSDLRDYENFDLEVLASGPDLSRILMLFGIHSIQEAPFMIDFDVERRGSQLTIERGRMLFAEAEFNAIAEMPNFPDVDDANIELRIEGQDIARFRQILNLPGAATGAFSIAANIETREDGIEIADMLVETSLGLLEARGTLGEEPQLVGTELRFDLRSPSLADLAGSYGLPRLPDEPVEVSGTARLENEGVRTRGPLVLKVADITVTMDGLLRTVRGLYGSRLEYGLEGPDLADLISAFADSSFIPAQPYRFNGILDIREDGFDFQNVSGRLGRSEVAVDGILRPVPDLVGTRFTMSANGPEIEEIVPASVDVDIGPGPYSLSGAIGFSADSVELDDIRLERELGEVELDLQLGRLEERLSFSVDADGRDVRSILSRIEGVEADEAPFSIDGRGEIHDRRLTLDDLDIAIGGATLNASGDLDLAKNARTTRFRFDLNVPSLARLGTFQDYRMRPQAFSVDATVVSGGGVLSIDELSAKLDDSDIFGSVRFTSGDVPRLDVQLASDSLLLASPLEEQERSYDRVPKFDDGRLIPDVTLPMELLRSFDASLDVGINDLIRADQHFRGMHLQAQLSDGELTLSRFGFDAPSGRLDARARLSPSGDSAVFDLEIAASDFASGLSKSNVDLAMTIGLQVNLKATGSNLRELAASSDGIVLIDTRGGRAANSRMLQALYGDMLEEILSVINPFYTADPFTNFECLIVPLEFDKGRVSSVPNVLIMTDKVRIVTTAEINLATEALDLTFRTTPRRGVIISAGEILNPFVKVVGTLAAPRLAVDEQGVLITGGAAVVTGGLSILARAAWERLKRSRDPCGDMSRQAAEDLGDHFADFTADRINSQGTE